MTGVTEKMIGSRLFINFCGRLVVPADSLRFIHKRIMSTPETQAAFGHRVTVAFGGGDAEVVFNIESEAQAILDWMNAPTTEPSKDQLREKLDSVTDEELIKIFEEIGVSRGMNPPSDTHVISAGKISGTGCFADAQPPRVGAPVFFDPTIKP